MINTTNTGYFGPVQNNLDSKTPKNLSKGQDIQTAGQGEQYDKLELSIEAVSKNDNLNITNQIETKKVSREKTIAIETLEKSIKQIDDSLAKADTLNLSFNDRLEFLKNEGIKWVEDIRQNDSEMFVQWLKMNKDNIRMGQADLANLPPDFTMKDYYSYVKEPFSIFV